MLIRRFIFLGVAFAGIVVAQSVAAPAAAGEEVRCPKGPGDCVVHVTGPRQPGSTGASGGSSAGFCPLPSGVCQDPVLGWYNPVDKCWYVVADPPPEADHPAWAGHQPGDGVVYIRSCQNSNGPTGVPNYTPIMVWRASPPPGFGGLPSPAQLAAEAINRLPIRGPVIQIAPDEAGSGLVGLPVWLWTTVGPETWGPISATAAIPGLSVTATARAIQIVWEMGDGNTVTCANPGTAYTASYGNVASPTCGYQYVTSSRTRPGGRFVITATTTWQVKWDGGGQTGELLVTRASTTSIQVDEMQVVTR